MGNLVLGIQNSRSLVELLVEFFIFLYQFSLRFSQQTFHFPFSTFNYLNRNLSAQKLLDRKRYVVAEWQLAEIESL